MRMTEKSSLASLCREEFVGSRQIDGSHLYPALVPQAYADAAFADASGVVGGAVDGVDYPKVVVPRVAHVFLLTDEAAAREQNAKLLAKIFLHGNVR